MYDQCSRKYNLTVGDYVKAKAPDRWQAYKIVGITFTSGLLKLISKHNTEGGFVETRSSTYPEDLVLPNKLAVTWPTKYDYKPGDMVDIIWLPEEKVYGSRGYSSNLIPHWVKDVWGSQKYANFSGLLRVKDCHPIWGVLVSHSHSNTSEAYIPRQCLKLARIEKAEKQFANIWGPPNAPKVSAKIPKTLDDFIRTKEVQVKPRPKKSHQMNVNVSYTGWMTPEHAQEITQRVDKLKADFQKYCEEDDK